MPLMESYRRLFGGKTGNRKQRTQERGPDASSASFLNETHHNLERPHAPNSTSLPNSIVFVQRTGERRDTLHTSSNQKRGEAHADERFYNPEVPGLRSTARTDGSGPEGGGLAAPRSLYVHRTDWTLLQRRVVGWRFLRRPWRSQDQMAGAVFPLRLYLRIRQTRQLHVEPDQRRRSEQCPADRPLRPKRELRRTGSSIRRGPGS